MINLINARLVFKVEICAIVCNLPLRTIRTWVSPKISWKLEVVLTWGQQQVVLHPKGSNNKLFCIPKVVIFGKMTAFGPVEALWS